MTKDTTREERLAAQLRANLKRRKAQARAMSGDAGRIGPQARKGDRPPAAGAACCASSEDAPAEAGAQDKQPPDLPKPTKDG